MRGGSCRRVCRSSRHTRTRASGVAVRMQAAGELQVAPRPGAAPLPPFQRWSFREERYIQWLADMQAAHLTLEAAVADASAVAATEHYGAYPRAGAHVVGFRILGVGWL